MSNFTNIPLSCVMWWVHPLSIKPCFTSDVTSKASHHKKILLLFVIGLLSNLRPLLLSFAYLLHMTLLIAGPTYHIGSLPTSPMWMRIFFVVLTCWVLLLLVIVTFITFLLIFPTFLLCFVTRLLFC